MSCSTSAPPSRCMLCIPCSTPRLLTMLFPTYADISTLPHSITPHAPHQVLAHVLALLQPAVASGRLPPAQLARVATRASDKVCAAHAGASDAGFLAQHSGSVARLVDKLLAHYAGLPPQQAPD